MKISIYTFVKNGLQLDYHVVEMLKHHIQFADEIIINEGYSTDGTYEKIANLDQKIKIFREYWDDSDPEAFLRKFKESARTHCTGDWCILLDCDEFIPEWEFDNIRNYLNATDKDIIPMRYINFYGNYKVYNSNPEKHNWPAIKHTIHRNIKNIEVWGDGSNVRFTGTEDISRYSMDTFDCHHFGFVRKSAMLRKKWHAQGRNFLGKKELKWIPSLIYKLFPHKWDDPDFIDSLSIYDGPYIKIVSDNPQEFVRDNFRLNTILSNKYKVSVL